MAMRPPASRGSKRRSPWTRLLLWVYFPLLFSVAALLVLLWKSGQVLLAPHKPWQQAEWAFVLPGETPDCEAMDAAIGLMADGRIDTLVLVGGRLYKTRWMTELGRGYLENQGLPSERLFEMRIDAVSEIDVARQILRLARLQQIDTLHLITSNFHSRLITQLYARLAGGWPVIRVLAADAPAFNPTAWWATPQSRELWLFEWMKLTQTWAKWWSLSPDKQTAEVRNLTPDIWMGGAMQEWGSIQEKPGISADTLQAQDSASRAISGPDTIPASSLLDTAGQMLDSLRRAEETKDSLEIKAVEAKPKATEAKPKLKPKPKAKPKTASSAANSAGTSGKAKETNKKKAN